MIQPNSTPPDDNLIPDMQLLSIQEDISAIHHLKMGKNLYQGYLAHARQQDLNAAIKHFQKALEIEPNLAEAYVQLASALWEQGTINLELAQFYCETALKLDPREASANLFLGYFLQRADLLDDAIQQYKLAINKDLKHSARPRVALGSALLKQSLQASSKLEQIGLASKGVTQFLTGCCMLPFDKMTCTMLKEAFLTDIQIYSINYLAKGFKKVGLPKPAMKLYHMGANLNPKEPLFYHLIGDEYLYEGKKPEEAILYYQKAQELDPDNLNLLKKLGKAYSCINNNARAIDAFNSVVELESHDFDTIYSLAQLYVEQRDYFKALYYFKEAEKQQPRHPYLHSNMAYLLFKMEDTDGAYEKYKMALEYGTEPEWLSTVAQTLGTFCFHHYQDISQTLDYFQQSLHYNPKNKDTLNMLADLYFETGHFEMALSTYKSILQMDHKNASCYSNIGYILWQLDKNQAAIDAYLTAIHYDPNNHIAYNNLGVIYLDEQKEVEKALPLFTMAIKLKPDYTLACFNIGRSLEILGDTLEAAEYYSESRRLNQLNPELEDAEIQERLDRLFD